MSGLEWFIAFVTLTCALWLVGTARSPFGRLICSAATALLVVMMAGGITRA